MPIKLGLDAKLYHNTGSYGAPVWSEISNVRDLTLSLEDGEADVTTPRQRRLAGDRRHAEGRRRGIRDGLGPHGCRVCGRSALRS